jgi:2,4-dichlorophenol 6-monooxygenase
MVRPWNEWMAIWGYDIHQPPPVLDNQSATEIVHNLIGDSSVPIKIRSISPWTVNHMYATRYSAGRVFCMGDAVHRHPPNNGLGSNTSIQDAYNLAWKLALVLTGRATPALLETYNDERTPIGKQIVTRANKSIEEFGPIFQALGLLDTKDASQMKKNMDALKSATPEAAERREKLRRAIAYKSYEYNAHGVEMNQRYKSAAVVSDGSPEPPFARDAELYYQPTTWPGARLPHVWFERNRKQLSSLDVAGKGRFTLLTGIGGEAWAEAALRMPARFEIKIESFVIGPGRDLLDIYGDWAEMRGISEAGCILVRPDAHVAWRSIDAPRDASDAENRLADVLGKLLGA